MEVESDDTTSLWLVKLPNFLYSYLAGRAARGEGGIVGSVSEAEDKSLRLELQSSGVAELEGKPSVFSVKPRVLDQELKCFRQETDHADHLQVVGSVVFRGDALPAPAQDAAYSDMMKGKLKV